MMERPKIRCDMMNNSIKYGIKMEAVNHLRFVPKDDNDCNFRFIQKTILSKACSTTVIY